jgi:hypothetical protein
MTLNTMIKYINIMLNKKKEKKKKVFFKIILIVAAVSVVSETY